LSYKQASVFERVDVREVTQRVEAELRQERLGGDIVYGGPGRGPEPIKSSRRRCPMTSRLISLPKNRPSSPRVIGWKSHAQ
jgi:hypothetical protein